MKRSIQTLGIVFLAMISLNAQDHMSPEWLWQLGRVSLEDVSPDGKTVIYGVTHYEIEENKGNKDIYSIPTDGGDPKKITAFEGSETSAAFRPDGKRIGFLRDGKLWEMNPDGSDKRQLMQEKVFGFKYSPGGNHLLYVQNVQFDTPNQHFFEGLPEAEALITDQLMYRHWDHWEDYAYRNIFIADLKKGKISGTPVNIMNEPYDSPLQPFGGMSQVTWSPDERYIAYTCKKLSGIAYAESTDSDIYLYDTGTGETKNISKENAGYDTDPVFSPDGRYIAWNRMTTPGFESDRNRVVLYDLQNETLRELTEGYDFSVNHPHFSPDGHHIYASVGDEATNQIIEIGREDGEHRLVTKGMHNYYDFIVRKDFIVGRKASMSMPHELFVVDIQNGNERQLTYTNKAFLEEIELGHVEAEWVGTTDGKQMKVWYIYPPGFDAEKEYPTLLYCQGGPQSAVSQFFSYRWNFQLMAAQGYIVVAPNRRGLPSFGRKWNDQISGDWGGQAMQDLLSASDHAANKPYVDEERLGAVGASFGGYSIYWLAGNHEGRFKTFISHCGLFNLESWYGNTEELFFANRDLGGPYWQEPMPESYQTDSPNDYIQNWDTPILVIHGGKDFRVPETEGMQAFQAACIRGVDARFLYFPDEGHWILSPQNGLLWHRVFFDWLAKSLK